MSKARFFALTTSILGVVALLASAGSGTSAVGGSLYRPCYGGERAELAGGVIRYCGPATARLSVFPGAEFENGTCSRYGENDAPTIGIQMGSRGTNPKTNNGFRYFHLHASSRPRLNEANVIAYSKGKRWQGEVLTKYDGRSSAGTFVARGVLGSRGRATGSFRCPFFDP